MKRNADVYILLLLAGLLLSAVSCVSAPRGGIDDVSADELKGMLDRKEDVVVVDTRTEYEYRQGRIPGALLIAPNQFNKIDALLPSRKDISLVFYCRGAG